MNYNNVFVILIKDCFQTSIILKQQMKQLFLIIFFVKTINSVNFVELMGLTQLLQDLAKLSPTVNQTNDASSLYMLDPSITTFLKQYKTRTEFCDYKCANFFDLPCFIVFDCNIQIRNFILIFFFPIFALSLTGLCCGKGIWTFSCWFHYLTLFTGVKFVIWAIKKCVGDPKQDPTKQSSPKQSQQVQSQSNQNNKRKINQLQIEPQSVVRMTYKNRGSSSSNSQ